MFSEAHLGPITAHTIMLTRKREERLDCRCKVGEGSPQLRLPAGPSARQEPDPQPTQPGYSQQN